jgi:hypothetical protein
MPNAGQQQSPVPRESLLTEADLDPAHVPEGFARSFVSKAKRPIFRYIAPGLSIPGSTSFSSQPFSSVEPSPRDDGDPEPAVVFPILLFRASEQFHTPHADGNENDMTGSHLPFSWQCSQVLSYPAGLYINEADRESGDVFEDTVKLVLPFGIGAHGFARTSDGARFGKNTEAPEVEPKDRHDTLYQRGISRLLICMKHG